MLFVSIFYMLFPFFQIETTFISRSITVSAATDPEIKYVYLTFDDGPLKGTSNCIDICEQQKVPATFFEVGMHQARTGKSKSFYERIVQNQVQFTLANHSYTHANGKYIYFYHHPEMAFQDFMKAQQSLAIKNNIIRLPGNSAWNTTNLKKASGLVKPVVNKLDSAGFNLIGWDVEWKFTKKGRPVQSPQKLVSMVDSALSKNHTATRNHVVILMHDQMFRASTDSAKLVAMVSLLKANPKYQLRKITQYPGLKPDNF